MSCLTQYGYSDPAGFPGLLHILGLQQTKPCGRRDNTRPKYSSTRWEQDSKARLTQDSEARLKTFFARHRTIAPKTGIRTALLPCFAGETQASQHSNLDIYKSELVERSKVPIIFVRYL